VTFPDLVAEFEPDDPLVRLANIVAAEIRSGLGFSRDEVLNVLVAIEPSSEAVATFVTGWEQCTAGAAR
jgi:hypothetical protein